MSEMKRLGRKARQIVNQVWSNADDRRYIPRALRPGESTGWGVWDKRLNKWVDDNDLLSIDAVEPERRS